MESPSLEELHLLHSTVCQAVSDPKRIYIMYALAERPRNVSTLAEELKMPQPTVSRHLRVLRQAALVDTERDGTSVIYSLLDDRIIEIVNTMRAVMVSALERQSNIV